MAKQTAAVLDFGSSKISVLIGERGINNTFQLKGRGESNYAGFMEGEFLDERDLKTAIGVAITSAVNHSGKKIKKLYVGVPAEFCYSELKEATQTYQNKKRINDNDIYTLFDSVDNYAQSENSHTLINRSPIYFMLDDGRKVVDPNGLTTTKLSAQVSFVLAKNEFITLIDSILEELSIVNVQYTSSVLAESLYLLEPEVRDRYAILIDAGYITTSVALLRGDGILSLNAFSVGGGHITGDLSQVLNLKFAEAEKLKRKVVLSLDASDDDFYETVVEGVITPFPAKMVNEIIEDRLSMVASTINKILHSIRVSYPDYIPIYLTGGGLSYLKGAKDFLSKEIGKNLEIISPPVPQLNSPHYSSLLGLLNLALYEEESVRENVFEKAFSKIGEWIKKIKNKQASSN
jgi:cell division protein FtsA